MSEANSILKLEVHDDPAKVKELVDKFSRMSRSERLPFYAGSPIIGEVLLRRFESATIGALELVYASDGSDYFATLYKPNPMFADLESYCAGRTELVKAVVELSGLEIDNLGVNCPIRQRSVDVRDLASHQLIELIQSGMDEWTNDTSDVQH